MKLSKKTVWSLIGMACAVVFFGWALQNWGVFTGGLGRVLSLFFPLLLGFCIAFVVNVPMRFFERHIFPNGKNKIWRAVRRPLFILLSVALVLAVVALVLRLVVPELVNAGALLVSSVQTFLPKAQTWAATYAEDIPQLEAWINSLKIDWSATGRQLIGYVSNGASTLLSNAITVVVDVAGGVTQTVIGLIFSLYILLDKEHLKRQVRSVCRAFLPPRVAEDVFYVANLTARTFANFITGQCTEACILGTLCWLGMMILRFPYAPVIGALVGMTALIPIVGAFIGTVVGAFLILVQNPMQALWFVVFLLCLQQFEGNLIYPHVVGGRVGLPPIWTLIAVTVGGGLGGLVGMLFAVPTCSVLYSLGRLIVRNRLAEQGEAPGERPAPHSDASPLPTSEASVNNAGAVLAEPAVPAPPKLKRPRAKQGEPEASAK